MVRNNISITDLVRLIKKRKSTMQPSFTLVLGSNYAGTFDTFLSSVMETDTPHLQQYLTLASSWGSYDRVAVIQQHAISEENIYFCTQLAGLIRLGFFTTIVTTVMDLLLEESLLSAGLSYSDIRVHILGVETERKLLASLYIPKNKVRIYKLYGSLREPDSLNILPREQAKLLDQYRELLRDLFSTDLVLFGYNEEYDNIGIGQFLQSERSSVAWFIDENGLEETSFSFQSLLANRMTSVVSLDHLTALNTLSLNLADSNSSSTLLTSCTVQIVNDDLKIVGTGFILSSELIVTCAHVVSLAGVLPGQLIRIRFGESERTCEALVLMSGWKPKNADLAILRLQCSLPDEKRWVKMGVYKGNDKHPFRVFGYPQINPEGIWILGNIVGRAKFDGFPVLQLDHRNIDFGVSGAPLLDENLNVVVGMVFKTYIPVHEGDLKHENIGYAIPSELLTEAVNGLSSA